jgi:MFS superfamily sulfate permease-like transporter
VESLGRYGDVRMHPGARIDPGILVYRLDDRLFFANAGYVTGRLREAMAGAPARVRYLVFDAEALNHVDATGIDALRNLLDDLDASGVVFLVARAKGPLRERLQATSLWERIGPERFLPTVRAAVEAALTMQRTQPGEA